MKITIGHLFYDLLNLYGESGNILALESALKAQGIDTEVINISLTDNLDLKNIDVIYIGSGTKHNEKLALDFLKRYKEELNSAINSGKFFLVTGNAIELFGKTIEDGNDVIDTLQIFDYSTQIRQKRIVNETVAKYDGIAEYILGFENHDGVTINNSSPLFTKISKENSLSSNGVEGVLYNNFYGTYLIGPLLARNPEFLENFCKKIILSKDEKFEFKEFNLNIEQKAHQKYLELKDNNK